MDESAVVKPSRLYRIGDEVTLTVRVTQKILGKDTAMRGAYVDIVGAKEYSKHTYLSSAELDTGTLAPRPVKCDTCGGTGEIDERMGGSPRSGTARCPDCK